VTPVAFEASKPILIRIVEVIMKIESSAVNSRLAPFEGNESGGKFILTAKAGGFLCQIR
jgi:hypothetical protein